MSKIVGVKIEADRGTTVRSPNFFSVEESTANYPTLKDIEAGILSGELTPVVPDDYIYAGMVKRDYNQPALVTLSINIEQVTIEGTATNGGTTTYRVVNFTINPNETNKWDNQKDTLLFDIRRTEIQDTNNVDIWVKGTIEVSPTITEQ